MASNSIDKEEEFPWHLGVFDAHCHPTDTMSSIASIPAMKSRCLTAMATRAEDQDLVASVAGKHGIKNPKTEDWKREECVVPAFGWHPWFAHLIQIDDETSDPNRNENPKPLENDAKIKHYISVLSPSPKDDHEDHIRLLTALPSPIPLCTYLRTTRDLLLKYPYSIIGEVGLDRSFRIPEPWTANSASRNPDLTPGGREGRRLSPFRVSPAHQKQVLKRQLMLAAELGRPVSIHGVQAHGAVYETIASLWKGHERKVLNKKERKKMEQARREGRELEIEKTDDEGENQPTPYPPRIALHSYTGPVDTLKLYLAPSIPADIFFSFSTAINLSNDLDAATPPEFEELLREVPEHMLLVESDLHIAGEEMDKRLEDMVRRICQVKGWGLEEGVRKLGANWKKWIFGKESG